MAEPLDIYEKNEDGTYVGLNFTKFPTSIDSWQDRLDLSSEMLSYANQYRNAMLANNYSLAQQILSEHPDLERMMIDAQIINEIMHAVMATERWIDENLQGYLGQYTDAAQQSAQESAASAAASLESSNNASQSENNAYQSEMNAEASKDEANKLVEDLRSLSGSLPSDFTEYVSDMDGIRDYVDNEIASHNVNEQAHNDIRNSLAKALLDIQILKLNHETNITTNTFIVGFEDLNDVTVTGGTWDVANNRIYF